MVNTNLRSDGRFLSGMFFRVFMGIVKETEYRLNLGMNVFTVTV